MRSFLTRATALGVFAMAVAGCAASNGTALPPTSTANNGGGAQGSINGISTGTAAVRFVHGSPDAGPVDICVDGTFLITNFKFETTAAVAASTPVAYTDGVSSFFILTGAVPHAVSIYAYTNGDLVNGACGSNPKNTAPVIGTDGKPLEVSVTPASNVRTSIVIAGTVANGTLTASNITYAAAAALNLSAPITPVVNLLMASPTNPSLSAGYFNQNVTGSGTPALTAASYPAGSATATKYAFKAGSTSYNYVSSTSNVAPTLPGFAASPGVGTGFYLAATGTPTTPTGCFYPGKAQTNANCSSINSTDSTNANDVIPFPQDNDYLLTMFAVDSGTAGKPALIGAFDTTTLGY